MIKLSDVNAKLIKARYAVRGEIVARAQELEQQGKKIIYCNIGNPQALKQKPITFGRQLLSLLEYPELLEKPATAKLFPPDVIARAKLIIEKNPHGTGAYTQSAGIPFIRKAVADFIHRRDGIPTDMLKPLREVKRADEIKIIRQSCHIAAKAYEVIKKKVKPGREELGPEPTMVSKEVVFAPMT